MGILHSCLYNKLRQSELVAICDNTPINLRLLKSILPKVHLYEDYNQMLESSELDLVVITTPVFLHNRMAKKALEKGSAVFVEKPLALSADESQELVRLSKNSTISATILKLILRKPSATPKFSCTASRATQTVINAPL